MELVLIQHYISYVPKFIHFKVSYSSYFFPDFYFNYTYEAGKVAQWILLSRGPTSNFPQSHGKAHRHRNSSSRGI